MNTPGGVYVDGVVGGEGVAGVGTAVVGHQAGGPVHRPQVQPTLHHHISRYYPSKWRPNDLARYLYNKFQMTPMDTLSHTALLSFEHRFNMEVDLQSLFGLHVT